MTEESAREKLMKEIREQIEVLEALIEDALGEKVRVKQESNEERNPWEEEDDMDT